MKLSTKIIIGIVVSVVCLCILIGVFLAYRRRNRNIENKYHTTAESTDPENEV